MAPAFNLEIVTPERNFFSGDVEMLIIRTPDGEMGILPGHIPMVVAVAVGSIRILQNGEWLHAAVSEGFSEIKRDQTVMIVDAAEWPHEIDVKRAEAAKERALERLNTKLSRVEYMRTQAALSRAMARLKVTKEFKHQ